MEFEILIPVGPGDLAWEALVPNLMKEFFDCPITLIGTSPRPQNLPKSVQWLISKKGRAHQLNFGARNSKQKYLWFLHSDSRLPSECRTSIEKVLQHDKESSLYFFDLRFYDGSPIMKMNELGVWFRSHVLKIPFGDQGFLTAKFVLQKLGGFDESVTYGEDHLLIWKAHQLGISVLPMGRTLSTSNRKYQKGGWLPTTFKHLALTIAQAAPEVLSLCRNRRKKQK